MQQLYNNNTQHFNLFTKIINWKPRIIVLALASITISVLLLDWNFVRFRLLDESLAPTYWSGQKVVTSRTAYWLNRPRKLDLVIYSPVTGVYFAGRVLALPGERVALQEGKLLVNGVVNRSDFDFGTQSIPEIGVPKNFICLEPTPSEQKFRLVALNSLQGRILGKWQILII